MKHLCLLLLITTLTITTNAEQCVRIESCPMENSKDHTDHRPYPYNCHKFYKCNYGCGYLFECPYAEVNPSIQLVFNPEKEVCDWPSNVPGRCGTSPPYPPPPPVTDSTDSIIYPPVTTYPPSPPVTYPPSPTVTYPPSPIYPPPYPGTIPTKCPVTGRQYIAHESNCQYYYECNNGDKKLRTCNENLIFNPYVEACDYPEFIRCITTGNLPE